MSDRIIETAGPTLARILFGWDTAMWRYRNPWGPWMQGNPPPTPEQGGSHE